MAIPPKNQVAAPAEAQAPKKHEPGPLERMKNRILGMKGELAMIMPKEMNAERITRIMINCIQDKPALLECTENSFLGCLFKCAQYGMEPNTGDGFCYLIPYKNVCTFQIGYQGIMKLARNTQRYARMDAMGVYKGDYFAYSEGFDKALKHEPRRDPETGAPIREGLPHTYYALYEMKDGTRDFKVWTRDECMAHGKRFSKAFGNGPWQDHPDRMCKKTVLIDLFKYADKSVEVMRPLAEAARADFSSVQLKQGLDKSIILEPDFKHIESSSSGQSETMYAIAKEGLDAKENVRLDLLKTAEERFQAKLDGGVDMVTLQNKIGMSRESMKDMDSQQLMAIIEVLGK